MLWLLGLIPGFLQWTAIATIVGTAGWFVWDYQSAKSDVASLTLQVSERENRIKVLEANRILDGKVIESLNEVALARNKDLQEMCSVLGEVGADTDPNADKPVGGVISKALKRLKELRGAN